VKVGFTCYGFDGFPREFAHHFVEHVMGLFCVNMHFRTTDEKPLAAALNRRNVNRFRLLAPKGGWVSLYEEQASRQDDDRIRELTSELSGELHAPAIAFMVHDSDIACYWLYDDGKLLDEFNSCPDYFDDDAGEPSRPSGNQPAALLPFCRSGVTEDNLTEIFQGENVFAESVVEGLAEALGIDPARALSDYRDDGAEFGGADQSGDGDDDDGDDGPASVPPAPGLMGRLAKMFGGGAKAEANADATALVQAAAVGDSATIERLLARGVAVDDEAPAPLPGGQSMAGLGQVFPGGLPKIAMTPLLAAIVHKHREALERLLDAGADPNRVHPMFGTALHAATGAGEVELLRLLIDRGGDMKARNAKGQTPLEVVAASRATLDRLAQAQEMMKSMGMKTAGLMGKLSDIKLPTEGWDACERLLKERLDR
jgi:hypothetical protein